MSHTNSPFGWFQMHTCWNCNWINLLNKMKLIRSSFFWGLAGSHKWSIWTRSQFVSLNRILQDVKETYAPLFYIPFNFQIHTLSHTHISHINKIVKSINFIDLMIANNFKCLCKQQNTKKTKNKQKKFAGITKMRTVIDRSIVDFFNKKRQSEKKGEQLRGAFLFDLKWISSENCFDIVILLFMYSFFHYFLLIYIASYRFHSLWKRIPKILVDNFSLETRFDLVLVCMHPSYTNQHFN